MIFSKCRCQPDILTSHITVQPHYTKPRHAAQQATPHHTTDHAPPPPPPRPVPPTTETYRSPCPGRPRFLLNSTSTAAALVGLKRSPHARPSARHVRWRAARCIFNVPPRAQSHRCRPETAQSNPEPPRDRPEQPRVDRCRPETAQRPPRSPRCRQVPPRSARCRPQTAQKRPMPPGTARCRPMLVDGDRCSGRCYAMPVDAIPDDIR